MAQTTRDNEHNQLQGILDRINGVMDMSAATSASFKARSALKDKADRPLPQVSFKIAAAVGVFKEA